MREIHYEVAGGIATLTIDRPDKRGAMTYAMLDAFSDGIRRASEDDDVRVLLVTGSGGSFCAGIDLADLAGWDPGQRGRTGDAATGQQPRGMLLHSCPKPVVAAVDGPAVGMGAEFATQADLRIASTRARFCWNFGQRGLVPDTGAGSWLLPRQVGLPAALRLLYTGDSLDASEALSLGYVIEVVSPDELTAAATGLAERIAAGSPFAARRTKQLVYDAAALDLDPHLEATRQAMAECFASEDHAEGVASFLERRPAVFTGR
ncbi:MAG: enoyl-CoA hydratase/isomerase family protein [Pseudonocardiaceae bacterium]|nr:enoyl-CoA hydratase/isomerase family protein [Pseudonocardiaceae bacterium]